MMLKRLCLLVVVAVVMAACDSTIDRSDPVTVVKNFIVASITGEGNGMNYVCRAGAPDMQAMLIVKPILDSANAKADVSALTYSTQNMTDSTGEVVVAGTIKLVGPNGTSEIAYPEQVLKLVKEESGWAVCR